MRAAANGSRGLITVLSVSLVLGLVTAVPAGAVDGFVDVEPNRYYADAVTWSVNNNITGIIGDRFEPDRPATRGETALWLWRMNAQPQAPAHSFTDVNAEQTHAVAWMAHTGITTGTSLTTFSPDQGLKRGQIAAFLWRLAGEPTAPAHSFSDVVAAWQQKSVAWLANTGITTGTSATTFSPDRGLTRAQLITFLYRYNNQTAPGTDMAPTHELTTITVSTEAPDGNCASEVSKGIYQWEICTWISFREDPDYHWSLSDEEAETLIQQIWDEVDVEGKPSRPPTSALVPAGTSCASTTETGFTIGCYQSGEHHIRRLDSFNDTLLHEVAHALVSGHPSLMSCAAATTNDAYQACVHNDIFRCVADYLYTRYAGIPAAGVCGTAPADSGDLSDANASGWVTSRTNDGKLYTYTNAYEHSREHPYEDDWAALGFWCSSDSDLEVYLSFGSGYLAGQFQHNERIPVSHAFYPIEYFDWSEQTQQAYRDENTVEGLWSESTTNKGTFLPDELIEGFVASVLSYDIVALRVRQFDDSDFGGFSFDLSGADQHIPATVAECAETSDSTSSSEWSRHRNDDGELGSYVDAEYHTREYPYEDTWASLVVVCSADGEVDIYLAVESGYLAGQYLHDNRIPVTYVFLPYESTDWDSTRQQTYVNDHGILSYWSESTTNRAAFLPDEFKEDFVNSATASGVLALFVTNFDDSSFGTFGFNMQGSYEHLRAVTEECGWTWS